MRCLICGQPSKAVFKARVLYKYEVDYFLCANCGFIQTENPYWLSEAYSSPIAKSDTGLVSRNMKFSKITSALIRMLFKSEGRFLDYGGGYGLLVRLMRDRGFDFYLYDQHCENLFAGKFVIEDGKRERFDLLTAFEVFEHLNHPAEEITKMLSLADSVLFSTRLLPKRPPRPGNWWYYSFETGQHVSFYSLMSLKTIASRFNLFFYTNRINIHLLSKRRVNPSIFYIFSNYATAAAFSGIFRRRSLLQKDYRMAIEEIRKHGIQP